MTPEILEQLVDAPADASLVLVTELATGRQWVLRADQSGRLLPGAQPDTELVRAAERALADDRAMDVDVEGSAYFVRPFTPPTRLVLVGAVHVAQSLAPMADLAGFQVVVVDPRPAWVTEFRLPGIERIRSWPEPAFAELAPDHRTAIVTLTHDPKVDDPALVAALRSPAFYVGALGSRRTHAKRLERLREQGFEGSELERIHSPVGLDIGARTPSEIAVAILAEVLGELRRPR